MFLFRKKISQKITSSKLSWADGTEPGVIVSYLKQIATSGMKPAFHGNYSLIPIQGHLRLERNNPGACHKPYTSKFHLYIFSSFDTECSMEFRAAYLVLLT